MKPSKFAQKRVGTLNKFYTRSSVGQLIADQLEIPCPESMLDLGSGEGSLSVAVADRWPSAKYVTVDLDPQCLPELEQKIAAAGVTRHVHHTADALESSFNLVSEHGEFDLAVCNPPFFKPSWRREYSDILQEGNLERCVSKADVTAEVLYQSSIMLTLGIPKSGRI